MNDDNGCAGCNDSSGPGPPNSATAVTGEANVKRLSTLGYWKLVLFGKPEADRMLYRFANRELPVNILEFGLETGRRAEQLIQVVQRRCGEAAPVRYTGVDLFEGRPAGDAKYPLIEAHRRLSRTGAKIRLLPGDFATSLPRIANQIQQVDLLIVSVRESMADLAGCWFYVPRLLSEKGVVMLKCAGEGDTSFLKIGRAEVDRLAQRSGPGNTRRVA